MLLLHRLKQYGGAPLACSLALLISSLAAPPVHADARNTPASDTAAPTAPPPAAAPDHTSDACIELGAAARAVAAWRDAGGAAWMAKAKLDQHIAEPAVQAAAQQLVDTLYSDTMRKLGPDETALAVTDSCQHAPRSQRDPLPPPSP